MLESRSIWSLLLAAAATYYPAAAAGCCITRPSRFPDKHYMSGAEATAISNKYWLPGVEDCFICAATDAAGWQVELRVKVCPQNNERRVCRRLCVALPSCAMMAPWACAVNAQCVLQTVGTEAVTVTTHDVEGGEVGVGVGMCGRGGVGVRDPIGMGC